MVEKIGPKLPRQPAYLREWRKHRRLTQQALAERMGTTKATISRYETARRKYPGGFLAAFAEAVDCAEVDLFEMPGESRSIDAMLRNVPPSVKEQARAIIEALIKAQNPRGDDAHFDVDIIDDRAASKLHRHAARRRPN